MSDQPQGPPQGRALQIPAWGLCPWRSPVVPKEPSPIFRPADSDSPPPQALGPCLYLGCGLWKVTKWDSGRPVDGMCSLRYIAECAAEKAGALQRLTQLAYKIAEKVLGMKLDPQAPPEKGN